jgi:hypothetical protein
MFDGWFAMTRKLNKRERLDALVKICLALPQTSHEEKGFHSAFLSGKRFSPITWTIITMTA